MVKEKEVIQRKDTEEESAFNIPWDKAPKWARWAARDPNSEWWWYEFKPVYEVCLREYDARSGATQRIKEFKIKKVPHIKRPRDVALSS